MKTYVADTKRNGRGIFAQYNLKPGEYIFIVEGQIVRESYERDKFEKGRHWLGIGHQQWINPTEQNPMYFTNHSCNPNAVLEDRLKVVAARPIPKDQEITIDYALTEEDPYWQMNCNCGEKECRRLIVSQARF